MHYSLVILARDYATTGAYELSIVQGGVVPAALLGAALHLQAISPATCRVTPRADVSF